tara:strand:+ start:1561 stop:2025 length:465 start_codon:yes stop_codon:yes gene_type:complete
MKVSKMIQYTRNPLESWAELKKRHFREKIELLESLTSYTLKQASNILGIDRCNLATKARQYGIKYRKAKWPSQKEKQMSSHSVKAKLRNPNAPKEHYQVDHLTFEMTDTTYALIAGEAVLKKDRKPLFTGIISKGISNQLRFLANQFDEREEKL